MTDNSLLEDFADETREHLEELEGSLLRLESDPGNRDLLNTIFRSMHTIKGASEYLGFERIARLSHRLENLLDLFREDRLEVDKVAVDLLIDARDRIGDLVSQVEVSGQESAEVDDLLERAAAIASGPAPAEDASAPAAETVYEGEADAELFGIFMEQLTAGLEQLVSQARRMAGGAAATEVSAEMAEQVERLAATANYMGYDALSAQYDTMLAAVNAFCGIPTPGPEQIDAFVRTFIVDGIACINALFPTAPTIEAIDTSLVTTAPDEAPGASPGGAFEIEDALDQAETVSVAADTALDQEPELTLAADVDLAATSGVTDPAVPVSLETDTSLLEDFADETREHLEELEGSLLRLESDPGNRDLLNTIFRSMHTIKGASEYLGFERIARLSHRLENLLDLFREDRLEVDKDAVDLLIDARDRIGDLVSQVEVSGQESAEVDDLVERAAAIASGPAPAEDASAPAAETVYEGEADAELFGIFMEQLTAGLEQLVSQARRMAGGAAAAEVSAEMAEQVERLATTANYMGYDALSAQYDTMLAAVNAFCGIPTPGPEQIDAFVRTFIVDGIDCIKALFPNQTDLANLETASLVSVGSAGEVDTPVPAMPDAAEAIAPDPDRRLPGDDIAELLADLPTIDDGDRESLLAKSLDDTFSSMRNGDGRAADTDAAELDMDPIAMQFSSPAESPPASPPATGFDAPDEAMAIIDDFGLDSADEASFFEVDPDDRGASISADDDDAALWPIAENVAGVVPPEPVADAGPVAPPIDFSASALPAQTPAEPEAFAARSSIRKSIRVDADKVDDLMDQVGELVVNRSSFMQLFEDMRELAQYLTHRFAMDKADQRLVAGLTARLNDATTVLGRVSTELQEQVMNVRMLPISRLFNRYPRLVHDLVKASDKKIQLQLRGEETELDRMVIEQLADPMIHIIRNAVDHGIESQEERQHKGKPESGVLLLEAYHEGSNVIIEVTDDGNGIDLSRIRQKAVEKQLADRESLERMDQQALIDMIMLPGFSTTDRITHTSGRGVGMDVVKRNIEKINGSLVVDTRQDVGTRFRIKIPLTLAIIPALMVRCAGNHFTVPLSAVEETLRIDRGELFTVDGCEIMHLHEEPLPLVRLSELLNLPKDVSAPLGERLFVVVIKAATGRTGFIVDTLLGRQEVVIKPLEDYLQENSGFSGATILGDGSISLILDVDELVIMAKERETERKLAAAVL